MKENQRRRRRWAEVERKCHAHERARSFVRSGDDRPIGRIGEGLSEGEEEPLCTRYQKKKNK